jgi:hypothetical protein
LGRICNHVTEAVEESEEGQEKNPNRTLMIQLMDKLPEEVPGTPLFAHSVRCLQSIN